MSSKTSTLPKEATEVFESIAHCIIDAINTRDLSIHSPAWANCAAHFMAERGGIRSDQQNRWVDLQGLLDDLKELTARYPEYHIKLNECSIRPGATDQSALFYALHAVTGDPPGIAMFVVGTMAFELIEGKWKLVRYWATMGPPAIDALEQV